MSLSPWKRPILSKRNLFSTLIQDFNLWNLLKYTCLPAASLHGSGLAPPVKGWYLGSQNIFLQLPSLGDDFSLPMFVSLWTARLSFCCHFNLRPWSWGKQNNCGFFPHDSKALVLLALGGSAGLWCFEKGPGDWLPSQRQRGLLCLKCSCFFFGGKKGRETN